jgi:cytoskeleton protein RodZ
MSPISMKIMSQSLGEQIREAREAKGLSIADVAEQTRISALYLQSIENDDYKPLPGGIFNKGFVKSYAKFVGINEQDALAQYQKLTYSPDAPADGGPISYRPEVLTDDRSSQSMIPTALLAVIILGVMTAGVLYLVDYMRRPADEPAVNQNNAANTMATSNSNTFDASPTPASTIPDFSATKFEITALNQPLVLIGTKDGEKIDGTVRPGSPLVVEPKDSLTLNYNRWNAPAVELAINGEKIALPAEPLDPKDGGRIIFTISRDNFADVWTRKAVSGSVAAKPTPSTEDAATTSTPTPTPASTPVRTATPRPTPATNAAARPPATNTQPTPARSPVARPTANVRPTIPDREN